jgi:iron complex transport system substrate-binding protein
LREPRIDPALREKERGQMPHGFSWGFFIVQEGRMRRIDIALITFLLLCSAPLAAAAVLTQQNSQARDGVTKRSVVDEVGRSVAVPTNVRRIVTLAPNLAEIVYALGAEDRLVGVSEYSDHPPAVKTKPSIGMPVNPSLEAIVGARPDLVLATTAINFAKTVDALARLGIPVYTTDPHTVDGTLRSITDIGDVIGAAPQAQSLVAKLLARLDALKAKVSNATPTRALFVVWENPLISIGDNTFIADALHYAGAESAIHTKTNWPQINMEEVVKLNPDYIVYADNGMNENSETSSAASHDIRAAIARHLDDLRGKPVWRELPAVREGHVAVVDDEIQVPAPGLIDTIEQLARELHPDLFAQHAPSAHENIPAGRLSSHNHSWEAACCAR